MNLNEMSELTYSGKFKEPKTIPLRTSKKYEWSLFISLLVFNDILMGILGILAAYLIRFFSNLPLFENNVTPSSIHYSLLLLNILVIWIVVFSFSGLYDRKNLLAGAREYSLLFNATTLGVFFFIAIGFLSKDILFARAWLVITWVLSFLFIGLGRFAIRRLVLILRERGFLISRAVIVGANEESRLLAGQLIDWKYSGLFIVGFIDDQAPPGAVFYQNLSILGNLEDLDNLIRQCAVQEVILSGSALTRGQVLQLFNQYGVSDQVKLRMSSGLYEILTTGLQVQEFASVPLIAVNKLRLTGTDQIIKTSLDYLLTVPGLIFFIPIFIIVAILIKLDSKGPVFYRRRVMGINGHQFDAFKFRTMFVNGEEILDRYPDLKAELLKNYKLKIDPRVTRMGKWLRKTSLDELPQIFNILLNQMSLVGPRMISPEELPEFKQWGMNLLTIKPGLTGLWQVSGRSDVTYENRVRLDMYYIRNWSIWLDLQVLFRTIPTVLSRRGAY
jgi:exopolysaccharide biosynthesis polyprenyl glycosylphosphotransferase